MMRIKVRVLVTVLVCALVLAVAGAGSWFSYVLGYVCKLMARFTAPQSIDFSQLSKGLSKEVLSEFNLGLSKRKALYMDMPFAFPHRYVLKKDELSAVDQAKVEENEYIHLEEEERTVTLQVGSVIYATGWQPYDVTGLSNLGAGTIPDCVSNMQMERLAAAGGPTNGRIRLLTYILSTSYFRLRTLHAPSQTGC